jgi:DNA polymerase III subunit gamma/tau
MSYQVIARKWRPQTFEEVTGQEHITQTLRNALEYDRLHHAYLFSGARGVGKTTTARLLAKALNCHKTKDKPNLRPCSVNEPDACPSCVEISESRSMDVLEIDAASHTGIDDVRDSIIENINVNPARDRYKVFIIDEVHQLSKPAFNALLKTLEEPPPNIVFVMATTEHHKVPETITSRCQEFEFRTIAASKIFDRLKLIAVTEKIDIEDSALREIARSGEGSMRDAQSNFDQVISFSGEKIEAGDVMSALGMASVEILARTVAAVADHDPKPVLDVVEELISRGHDLRNFCRDLMAVIRDLAVYKTAGGGDLMEASVLGPDQLEKLSAPFSVSDLVRIFNSLANTESRLKDATQTRYALEIGLVSLVEMRRLVPLEDILERLAKLESSLSGTLPRDEREEAASVSAVPAAEEKKTLIADEPPAYSESPQDPPEPDELIEEFSPEPPADDRPLVDISFVESTPIKLPLLTSEELEHIDDSRLDAAFEDALLGSGDDLKPINKASEIVARLFEGGVAYPVASSGGTAAAVARDYAAYMPQLSAIAEETSELPVLSDQPTEEELMAYAAAHPEVRKVMRVFGAKIVGVRRRE